MTIAASRLCRLEPQPSSPDRGTGQTGEAVVNPPTPHTNRRRRTAPRTGGPADPARSTRAGRRQAPDYQRNWTVMLGDDSSLQRVRRGQCKTGATCNPPPPGRSRARGSPRRALDISRRPAATSASCRPSRSAGRRSATRRPRKTACPNDPQASAAKTTRRPRARAPASARGRDEWRARIAAEYGSAAITQHLVLWMIQIGASPDVIDAGLRVVADELVHSRMSHQVYADAGGDEPPVIDRGTLELARPPRVRPSTTCPRVAGCPAWETVALFSHLRAGCTGRARRADRILATRSATATSAGCLDWLHHPAPRFLSPRRAARRSPAQLEGTPADEPSTSRPTALGPRPARLRRSSADVRRDTARFAARGIDATPRGPRAAAGGSAGA
jgi:hypothetical protein